MNNRYSYYTRSRYQAKPPRRRRERKALVLGVLFLVLVSVIAYKLLAPTSVERAVSNLNFDQSVAETERQTITEAIRTQSKTYRGTTNVHVNTVLDSTNSSLVLAAYVPVANVNSARQTVTKDELGRVLVRLPVGIDATARAAFASLLAITEDKFGSFSDKSQLADKDIALLPIGELSSDVKLLRLEGAYYLDDFNHGAIFRQVEFSGDAAQNLSDLKLNSLPAKDVVLKINQTGVTALTREMMTKLGQVKDPTYFAKNIGIFLADADVTHVSNEVSFKPGCTYNSALFCSPPEMIETLKASGVDVVELTGNHNNDVGRQYNTDTINLYHSLGWGTFGGGLNSTEASKPYVIDKKGSQVIMLGYNYADSPNGGSIATKDAAGSNIFDFDKIKQAIDSVRQQGAQFVVVDVQFWECYAYPNGYVEYPQCDQPIGEQTSVFKKIIDQGADMVVGTQAHQPQIYEFYKNKPIYYGLGNLYFDQDSWPGTEKGIVLTHYFLSGRLLQTKLSPTRYHSEYQTRLMTDEESVNLLERLAGQ